jgi:hypothetical protein
VAGSKKLRGWMPKTRGWKIKTRGWKPKNAGLEAKKRGAGSQKTQLAATLCGKVNFSAQHVSKLGKAKG